MNQAERVMGKPLAYEEQAPYKLLSGREGYTQAMGLKFPDVYEWEIQIALAHHRSGGTLESLRQITPFRQYLRVESETPKGEPFYWKGSFTKLFSEVQTIGQCISFGMFDLIQKFGKRNAERYARLGVDTEAFYQEALFDVLPPLVDTYNPSLGKPFYSYAASCLIFALDDRNTKQMRRVSFVPAGETNHWRVSPMKQTNRVWVERLDVPVGEREKSAVNEIVAEDEADEFTDSLARVQAIDTLFEVAGVTKKQAEAIMLICLNELHQERTAQQLGISERQLRNRRDKGLALLHNLGKERVLAILRGESLA